MVWQSREGVNDMLWQCREAPSPTMVPTLASTSIVSSKLMRLVESQIPRLGGGGLLVVVLVVMVMVVVMSVVVVMVVVTVLVIVVAMVVVVVVMDVSYAHLASLTRLALPSQPSTLAALLGPSSQLDSRLFLPGLVGLENTSGSYLGRHVVTLVPMGVMTRDDRSV